MKDLISEIGLAGSGHADANTGAGYGKLSGGMMSSRSVAAKKGQAYPYSEPVTEIDPEDEVDIDDDFLDAFVTKLNLVKYATDPYARVKQGKVGRYGPGMAAGPDLRMEGIASGARRSGKTRIDQPSVTYGLYKNRGPVVGGMSPTVYKTAPGDGAASGRRIGTKHGFSSPPLNMDDDGIRIFNLEDLLDPDLRAIVKARKNIARHTRAKNDH